MALYQKPRIVLEESSWGKFFQELPNLLLSFKGQQQQAIEAEKTRQHQEDMIYLRSLLDTKGKLQTAFLDARKTAVKQGATLDFDWQKIFNTTPESSTKGGLAAFEDTKNIYQSNNDNILDAMDRIDNETQLAMLGARDAQTIDANFDSELDTAELGVFQKENPELFEQFGVTEFPESYLSGARAYLDTPEVRQAQKDRFAINREIYNRYDSLLDKDEDGNIVQLYKSFDIDPNQRGKAELEQALLLLELGADPKIVQTQLSQVETAKPVQYSFGDKTYTQVSNDQVIAEDDGTMTAMMGGEKVKVVGDIAAYPGMKFVTGERYKPSSKGVGAGDRASQIWDKIQAEYDNSTAFYNTQLSSKEDRESYISEEIGAQLMNPGKIKFDKDEMTKEGADKVKKILGANILLIARWGEDSFWGLPWRNELEKLLNNGDYEGVVDYYMDPETRVARLKELDLSDSDMPLASAAEKARAENTLTLFKQHLKDYDMLDRPADWLVDNPRIGSETTKDVVESPVAPAVENNPAPVKPSVKKKVASAASVKKKTKKPTTPAGLTANWLDDLTSHDTDKYSTEDLQTIKKYILENKATEGWIDDTELEEVNELLNERAMDEKRKGSNKKKTKKSKNVSAVRSKKSTPSKPRKSPAKMTEEEKVLQAVNELYRQEDDENRELLESLYRLDSYA